MTSPANQQNPVPATNTTATTATSYASAAGAPQKPAQTQPPVAASGSQPPVVVGPSASPAQDAKSASPSLKNGKPAVAPAVPTVSRGSTNGAHSRHSSVTMAANGPNSYAANGGHAAAAKSGIQFGFGSPGVAHSSPQTGNSAPIPIPGGNPRITSPAHSPSPIPQPSASGGRPPSGLQQPGAQMTFGSLNSDSEVSFPSRTLWRPNSQVSHSNKIMLQRHMRQGSVPPNPNAMGSQQPGTHFRRESNHSVQSEGPGGPNRANFAPQGNRGRGFNAHNNSFNHQMGYPPNNQFRNGPGQGRGMPPAFQPQAPRNMAYPNSPQPNHRSPAMVPSMPGTPNMPPSQMQPAVPPAYYGGPMPAQPQQVLCPLSTAPMKMPFRYCKKTKSRRDSDRSNRLFSVRSEQVREPHINLTRTLRRPIKNIERRCEWVVDAQVVDELPAPDGRLEKSPDQLPPPDMSFHPSMEIDMKPGKYEQLLLTMQRQSYGYPPGAQQMDPYGRSFAYQNMPYMHPPQANSPGYNQAFVPPQYHHQSSHSMSRTPSQQERPSSANQHGPPVAMGSNKQQTTPSQSNSEVFSKPRKSAAIPIKTASGEVVDTSSFKVAPASPAPSSQQAKTPPVASSNPTPPPKASTPAHSRTDSHTTQKTAKEIQDELKEKIKQATQAKDTTPAPASQVPEAKAPEEPKPKVETDSKPAPPEKAVDETAPAKAEDAPKEAEAEKPAEPTKTEAPEEDEIERIIREMEEADARREKEEAEHRIKADAEKAAAKKKAEEDSKVDPAEADRKLREQEREMERLEEEKEKKRQETESSGKSLSVAEALAGRTAKDDSAKVDAMADKLAGMKIGGDKPSSDGKPTTAEKRGAKPAALNLAPLNTKPVDPPQPSAALQSLKSARFLQVMDQDIYPEGISSPNPALNAAVAKKGKTFKYDASFLLQFQKVFTEQPSVEFHQQVKALIGDSDGSRSARGGQTPGSSRQNSRGNNFPTMGNFNAGPARTIPSGTTSAERFAQSNNGATRSMTNPMASFRGPGGQFPMGSSMSRNPSQGMGSGRQSSRRGGNESRRGNNQRDKDAKNMPLTAGQDLKPITVSATGWKPISVGKQGPAPAGAKEGHMDPEMVQRKVKAALNKMTPENFERISDQILAISSQSKDETDGRTLRQVIQLTFEKATDEAHWASMYAKFCKKMLETMSPEVQDERIKDKNGNTVSGGNLFRKYLLNRCQEEFERGWKTHLPEKESEEGDQKPGEAAMLSDEYYAAAAAKRRGLGLVQFIGELYKLGMLTERIMIECVHKLVDYKGVPDEAEIESLSKLLRTIGQNLDMSEKGRPMMDVYFGRIQQMMDLPELPSRMKFMLMDVVDLRRANWISKETNKGPKTLEEVRAEVSSLQGLMFAPPYTNCFV